MSLWLPPGHAIHQTPPKFLCTLCEWVGWEEREYVRHVMGHPVEDLHPYSPQTQAPGVFSPDAGDKEWGEWIDRNHKAGNDPMRYMRTDDKG